MFTALRYPIGWVINAFRSRQDLMLEYLALRLLNGRLSESRINDYFDERFMILPVRRSGAAWYRRSWGRRTLGGIPGMGIAEWLRHWHPQFKPVDMVNGGFKARDVPNE